MKSKLIHLATIVVAFLAGYVISYLVTTKNHMDSMLQAKNVTAITTSQDKDNELNINTDLMTGVQGQSDQISLDVDDSDIKQKSNKTVSTNDYTADQVRAIIDEMPNVVLEQYIDKFMTKDASSVITDKRRFAERAIEELYEPNDNRPLSGDIRLSYDSLVPTSSIDTSTVAKDAKLFAHIDTNGQVPTSPYVFVKWVNNNTGQVLLFEKKDIVADSRQNWVSLKPYDGWQVGSYDIRFYQFTSELEPIAQLTYNIYSVEEAGATDNVGDGVDTNSTNTTDTVIDLL